MKNNIIIRITLSIILTSLVFISCKKDIREPSVVYKAPVYPAAYTTPPCEADFYKAGNNLSFKRSIVEIISGNLAFYPFFSYMDSTASTYYKSSNYHVYSFQDAVFSSNKIEILLKYFNSNNTGVYNIVSEDKLVSETLENNECVIRGNAGFQTFGSSGYYNFSIYPTDFSGKLYLGKDRYTNKMNFFVCEADCSVYYNGNQSGALLTLNLTY